MGRALKDKTGVSLVNAVDVIFEQGRVPERLQTDAGKEFLNKHFQKYLKTRNVRHFVTYNKTEAQIVERFNRTLGMRMWRYFTLKNSHRYVDVLPELVRGYNASYHRSIGMRPDQVTDDNAQEVWRRLYGKLKQERPVRFKFKVGDWVRITKKKRTFEKGYLPNWTEEIFRVVRRVARRPPVYQLNEYDGTVLKGTFYEPELERIRHQGQQQVFRVERILRRRGRGRGQEALVRWSGWPAKYDQWVPVADLQEL